MDVFETMKVRQSIRKFRKEPIPREHILQMAEAASWAPTAGNSQNFRFIAVQERETIARMRGIVDEIESRVTGSEIAG
ncbi:MAG TPA: nitroreductase family protein, partial [Patescibacteria group bacterium]|nr:nitroreductase family protein [Patescibacteria group bacterium]